MADNDRLYRFIIENTPVRGELVHLNATWQAILERSDYPDNVRDLLVPLQPNNDGFSVPVVFRGKAQCAGNGHSPCQALQRGSGTPQERPKDWPVNVHGGVAPLAKDYGHSLRGVARWNDEVPARDLQAIFGNGQMVITIEPTQGDPYQGIIALQGERLNDAIENYFRQSEQLNTVLWLASDEQACAGFLLQEMPGHHEDDEAWERACHLAATLTAEEILKLPTTELLHRLFHEDDVRLFEPEPVSFRCSCSRDRISSMLLSLGSKEVQDILQEQGRIKVDCEFCNAHYEFDSVDVEALFASSSQPSVPDTKH